VSRWALLAALSALGCKARGTAAVFPTQPAAGRSPLCPEAPVGVAGSPDVRRCSYEDAVGAGATRLSGRVEAASPMAGTGPGLEGIVVTVHVVDDPVRAAGFGRTVARARTDAQGRFSLSAVLPPGTYDVAARTSPEGPVLAVRRLRLDGKGVRTVDDLLLVVPLGETAPAAAPEPADAPSG